MCTMNVMTSTLPNEQTNITSNSKEIRAKGIKYFKVMEKQKLISY